MKVYVVVDTDCSARDCVYGVYASRELAIDWINNQSWLDEDAKEFCIIIENELDLGGEQ